MSELKLIHKQVNKDNKQKIKPINLIDIYFAITKKIFLNKNIKIKEGEKCQN